MTHYSNRLRAALAWQAVALLMVSGFVRAAEQPKPGPKPPEPVQPAEAQIPDAYKDIYKDYKPGFMMFIPKNQGDGPFRDWWKNEEEMKLSSEQKAGFFTLNEIEEADRANALVTEGLRKEKEGQFRDALKLYQMVIDKFPDVMYRVSDQGVFVPIRRYCQRRLLDLPAADLGYYRTLYDPRAKEAFEQAKRRNSMSGMAEIVESMLATSYGDNALLELGNAALDAGNYLEAQEYYTLLQESFKDSDCLTPDLQAKISVCRKKLGDTSGAASKTSAKTTLSPSDLSALSTLAKTANPDEKQIVGQCASYPNLAMDDYTRFPPSNDPLGLLAPTWKDDLADARKDFFVYSQPVVTQNSVIYRHKNIVYCQSLLNGSKRWVCDLGGRIVWQNWFEVQYPMEDVLVQDGLVFAPLFKVGPSLVALDEITGQVRWAYGPMTASNQDEARMRFESAPAGGDRTIFAGYALDNIEGDTHTDTEYGIIAFESTTGRVKWRTKLCALKPPRFSAGFTQQRRNKIRSFFSPPCYNEGTVYYNTNAGALCALDAASGQVKWMIHYPYYPSVHDAVRRFAEIRALHGGVSCVRPHSPMFWNTQRPLLVGERIYFTPVDTPFLLCVDRRNGRVDWARIKPEEGFTHFMGTSSKGDLILSTNGRNGPLEGSSGRQGSPVHLLNPKTGETTWRADFDPVMQDHQPVMEQYAYMKSVGLSVNNRWFEQAARPFLTTDDMLFQPTYTDISPWWRPGCYIFHLAGISLNEKKVVQQRRYYTGQVMAEADELITVKAPAELAEHEKIPQKNKEILTLIESYKKTVGDHIPSNQYGPFMPFSRMTFTRFGVPFELRLSPRELSMVFDREAVKAATAKSDGPFAYFTRAELAVAEGNDDEAVGQLEQCLAKSSPDDLDFRALVNQQLFQINRRLVQRNIFRAQADQELQRALGMSRSAGILPEEIETLFVLSEAYERQNNFTESARCLRDIVTVYGQHEYPVSPLNAFPREETFKTAQALLQGAEKMVQDKFYGPEMKSGLARMTKGLPMYASAASSLRKSVTVRAGDLAVQRLLRLFKGDGSFAQDAEKSAGQAFQTQPSDEHITLIRQYPGTKAAQESLNHLFADVSKMKGELARKRLWELADVARLCGLVVPDANRSFVDAPPIKPRTTPVGTPYKEATLNLEDADGTARLALIRTDDGQENPNLLFLGGRKRQKTDNKFTLTCIDLTANKKVWETPNIRFLGNQVKYAGDEWGFYDAYVYKGLVVVHGLYDVFCFDIKDAKQRWHYRVPLGFEIKSAAPSGRLFLLSGQSESIALDVETDLELGEVVWQEQETGDAYLPTYIIDDRVVSVRKLPFNLTVRYRGTGKLIGRLALPDLSLFKNHPLLQENGSEEYPAAIDGDRLVVTDSSYYICLDVKNLRVLWKRLIDNLDPTQEPPMRFYLSGNYLAVLKRNFDLPALYMLNANTGEVLWNSDPKDSKLPYPMHSILFKDGIAYGIVPHAGQGFYFDAVEAQTGKRLYHSEVKEFQGKPIVSICPLLNDQAVVYTQDNQDFAIHLMGLKDGKVQHKLTRKGVGPIGTHGRVSIDLQEGRLILLSKDELTY